MRRLYQGISPSLARKNWKNAEILTTQARELSQNAARFEKREFPQILNRHLAEMPPNLQALYKDYIADVSKRLGKKSQIPPHTSYDVMIAATVIASTNPVESAVNDTIDLIHTFYNVFIKDRPESFVQSILSANNLNESLYPDIVGNYETFKTWCENVEDYRAHPEILFGVAENILSALGKAAYQFQKTIIGSDGKEICLCVFKYSSQKDRDAFEDCRQSLLSPELEQIYESGPDGKFYSTKQSMTDNKSDNVHGVADQDGMVLSPKHSGFKPITSLRSMFFHPKHQWLSSGITAGVHFQYGPSGTTRSNLGAIGMLQNASGNRNFFVDHSLSEIAPLLVHTVCIPFLKAAYHTPVEWFIATACFMATAKKQAFSLDNPNAHPIQCMQEAGQYISYATQSGAPRQLVTGLLDSMLEFNVNCFAYHQSNKDMSNTDPEENAQTTTNPSKYK